MSHSAAGRLKSAALDLDAASTIASATWNDSKSAEFRAAHINPILRSVETACLAMGEIGSIIAQMKRECGPPREEIY